MLRLHRPTLCLLLLLGGAVAVVFQACTSTSAAKPRHPNLLIVFPDQMRGQAMGFLGEEPVQTPTLDRFAQQGLVLTQAVSNYPVCSPYRAMLMTGSWPHKNGVLANCNTSGTEYGYELPKDARCWSDVLHDQGYSLGYIGKWHLDAPREPYVQSYNNTARFAWNEWCAPDRRHGFDYWYAYGTFDQHNKPEYWTTTMTRDEREKIEQWGPEHEADQAIAYLRNEGGKYRQDGEPFALVVAMNPPHTPYNQVPKRYVDQYQDLTDEQLMVRKSVVPGSKGEQHNRKWTRDYYACITGVDDQFGRILQALDELHLAEDTIVLFTSDHGNCLGAHDEVTKNNHYEESMRVPFLVRWPGHIPAGKDDLLLSTPDIAPTLLDLMGFADDVPATVQGHSRAAVLCGRNGDRPTSQLYVFVPYGEPDLGRRGVRTGHYTLMLETKKDAPVHVVLHDNLADPWQLQDVAEQQPDVVRHLVADELLPWLARTGDPWRVPDEIAAMRR